MIFGVSTLFLRKSYFALNLAITFRLFAHLSLMDFFKIQDLSDVFCAVKLTWGTGCYRMSAAFLT